jgi:hypothetical protein
LAPSAKREFMAQTMERGVGRLAEGKVEQVSQLIA